MLPVHGYPEMIGTCCPQQETEKVLLKARIKARQNSDFIARLDSIWYRAYISYSFFFVFFFNEQIGALFFSESKCLKYCYHICLTTQSCPKLWHLWENKILLRILICLLASQMCVWLKCCLVTWQVPAGLFFQQRHIQKKLFYQEELKPLPQFIRS